MVIAIDNIITRPLMYYHHHHHDHPHHHYHHHHYPHHHRRRRQHHNHNVQIIMIILVVARLLHSRDLHCSQNMRSSKLTLGQINKTLVHGTPLLSRHVHVPYMGVWHWWDRWNGTSINANDDKDHKKSASERTLRMLLVCLLTRAIRLCANACFLARANA